MCTLLRRVVPFVLPSRPCQGGFRVLRFTLLGLPLLGVACSASGSSPSGASTVRPQGTTAEPGPPATVVPGTPLPTTPDGDPSFSDDDIEGVQDRCNELDAQFEKIVPSVVVLVDRSKSMFESNGDKTVRSALWDPLADALTNATDGVIPQLQSEVRFGFAAYNRDAAQATAACPSLASVPISLDNGAAISTAYAAAGVVPTDYYKWDTPTAESVRAVTAELTQFAEPGPKYLLLVTDGNPDRCDLADPQCGQDDAIAAVQAAYAAGITTFVVGIGEVAADANDPGVTGCWGRCGALHLQDLANAGSGLPVLRNTDPNFLNNCFDGRRGLNNVQIFTASYVEDPTLAGAAPYFVPDGRTALRDALGGILRQVRSCTFTLTQAVRPGQESTGNVALDAEPLSYADPDGWILTGGKDVQLQGAACERLQNQAENVQIYFPCEAYIR